MRVLVACEFSGVVRDAFTKRGHDAWSCDLIPTERPGHHIQGDVREILNDGWDLMIGHPPCTYLSSAGSRHLHKGGEIQDARMVLGLEAKELFTALWESRIPKICLENPVPSYEFCLPAYNQIVHPYYFGDPFKKRSCLWLKNLSLLKATSKCETAQPAMTPGNWFNKGGKERQKNRSQTFPGIARAMADQWG